MKEKKRVVSSSSMARSDALNAKRARDATTMHKIRSPESAILRRLREHLLYSKLRSLLPPPVKVRMVEDQVTEIEMEQHEIPAEISSDDEEATPEVENEEENFYSCTVELESEEEEARRPFVPSIDIKKMEDSILISAVALKEVALTSALFRILEEEKLDIVFENQYRTDAKVAHNIQVRVEPEYNMDALGKKLCRWAGGRHA